MIASTAYVYRLRPSVVVDSYGDERVDWTSPERVRHRRATIKRGQATDVKDLTGHAIASSGTLYVEALVDVRKDDRLEELDGTVWEVDGDAVQHRGLAGRHTVANLKRLSS